MAQSEYMQKYYAKNKEKIAARMRRYYAKPEVRARMMEWKRANRQRVSDNQKKYADNPKFKAERNLKIKLRTFNDPIFKLKKNLRFRIWYALRLEKKMKADSSIELMGCSAEFLKRHIESKFSKGMSWANYGPDGWHIDHILPCASFDLSNPDQQRKCFHWTNLQPLWSDDNTSKGAVPPSSHQPELLLVLRS